MHLLAAMLRQQPTPYRITGITMMTLVSVAVNNKKPS